MSAPNGRDVAREEDLPAPAAVASVTGEIQPGAADVWRPGTFEEWEGLERTRTFLKTWSEQVEDERSLRRYWAKRIFYLIVFQVVAVFAIVVAQGRGALNLDMSMLKILVPSVLADVFGLGFLVAKYLFSQALRHSLDVLAQGSRANVTRP